MSLFRSALCALVLCAAANPGWALDETAPGARDEACDIACQMQAYFNRDHMVRLVPKPQDQAKVDAGAPARKTRAAARRGAPSPVEPRRTPSVALAAPAEKPIRPVAARPARMLRTAPATLLVEKQEPAAPSRPSLPSPIPGSAPRVTTTQFVDPSEKTSAY